MQASHTFIKPIKSPRALFKPKELDIFVILLIKKRVLNPQCLGSIFREDATKIFDLRLSEAILWVSFPMMFYKTKK